MIRLGSFAVLFATALYLTAQASVTYAQALNPTVVAFPPPASPEKAPSFTPARGAECMFWEGQTASELVQQIVELDDESLAAFIEVLMPALKKRLGLEAEV